MSAVSAAPEARLQRRARWLWTSLTLVLLLIAWEPVLFRGKGVFRVLLFTLVILASLLTQMLPVQPTTAPARPRWRRIVSSVFGTVFGSFITLGLLCVVAFILRRPMVPDEYKIVLILAVNVAGVAFAVWLKEAIPAWFSAHKDVNHASVTTAAAGITSAPAQILSAAPATAPQVVTLGSRTP